MLPIMKSRWEYISLLIENMRLNGDISSDKAEIMQKELKENIEFVEKANIVPFLDDEAFAKIDLLGEIIYTKPDGEKVYFMTEEEKEELKIRKGTLTAAERAKIEEHVVYTDKILSKINFGKKYDKVRFIAGAHHEFINGTGYPNHLQGADIPLEVRILTIMDVFDSLSSSDRPYRKQSSLSETFDILEAMSKEGKLDMSLVQLARACFVND
jgi:hypothetical protein